MSFFFLLFPPCPSQSRILSTGDCWVPFIACPQTLIGMILWEVKYFQWLNFCEKEGERTDITISVYSSISHECLIKMAKWCRMRATMVYVMLKERPLNISYIPGTVWAWNFPILFFNKTFLQKRKKRRAIVFCNSGVISIKHKPGFISSHFTWLRNLSYESSSSFFNQWREVRFCFIVSQGNLGN